MIGKVLRSVLRHLGFSDDKSVSQKCKLLIKLQNCIMFKDINQNDFQNSFENCFEINLFWLEMLIA